MAKPPEAGSANVALFHQIQPNPASKAKYVNFKANYKICNDVVSHEKL